MWLSRIIFSIPYSGITIGFYCPATYLVNEDASVNVPVQIRRGTPARNVTVTLQTVDGSAVGKVLTRLKNSQSYNYCAAICYSNKSVTRQHNSKKQGNKVGMIAYYTTLLYISLYHNTCLRCGYKKGSHNELFYAISPTLFPCFLPFC